jgi:hypothetical protein
VVSRSGTVKRFYLRSHEARLQVEGDVVQLFPRFLPGAYFFAQILMNLCSSPKLDIQGYGLVSYTYSEIIFSMKISGGETHLGWEEDGGIKIFCH